MNRLERLLNRADDLGMVVILGYFYFGQDENLNNEEAVITAVKNAREQNIKAGYIKLETVWPFPEKLIKEAAGNAQKVIVVEMNLGQIFYEVERILHDKQVDLLPKIGGEIHLPTEILDKIKNNMDLNKGR
jgi:pyruvate/2-oxoacid:ferredoxin oxidoreductase alpha subunit